MVNDCNDAQAQLARWNKSGDDREVINVLTDPNGLHESDEVPDDVEESEDYSGDEWTKEALQNEAESRGLPKSGSKDDLRDRLLEDDESDD